MDVLRPLYPPPQRRAPTIILNNHSKPGAPFTGLLTLSPRLKCPGIVTIESETSLQFFLMVTLPCSDCWKKGIMHCLCFPSESHTTVPQPHLMFSAASGNYLAEHNSTSHWLGPSVASPHQCILAPPLLARLYGDYWVTHPFRSGEIREWDDSLSTTHPFVLYSLQWTMMWRDSSPILELTLHSWLSSRLFREDGTGAQHWGLPLL